MRWTIGSRQMIRIFSFFLTATTWHCGQTATMFIRKGVLPTSMALDTPCRSSLECLLFVPNSQCNWHGGAVCDCQPYHVRYNNSMCLKASLLTYGCAVNEQCRLKVPHSQCGSNGLCECQSNFMPYRLDKCLPPARVDDYCLNDVQCHMSSRYSYCKYIIPRVYGKCKCPHGYMLSHDQKCLPYLDNECKSNDECAAVTPHSRCNRRGSRGKRSVCICSSGFKMSKSKLRCEPEKYDHAPSMPKPTKVKPVSLGKPCNWTEECKARDPHSTCLNGHCSCMKPTDKCNNEHRGCLNDTFQCRNGQCISWYFICDGMKNCADGSDEAECKKFNCPKGSFQCDDGTCKSRATVCNGKWECPDGSDEARCYKGITCDKNAFQCKNGQCLPQYVYCNAVVDCTDGSDEDEESCTKGLSCPSNSFRCTNNMCRSSAILCSGVDGCGDNSDEIGCEVCKCEKP